MEHTRFDAFFDDISQDGLELLLHGDQFTILLCRQVSDFGGGNYGLHPSLGMPDNHDLDEFTQQLFRAFEAFE